MNLLENSLISLLQARNLPIGTTLENRVTWQLHRWKALDKVQYRIDRYRLDFAWPSQQIALEADGPFHLHPETAMKDVVRDRFLRSIGWLTFRVDEESGSLEEQLCRVVQIVNAKLHH